MARAPRGNPKAKRKAPRASAARLRRKKAAPEPSPRVLPVRTALTPRPNLEIPIVSLENVDWEDAGTPLSPLDRWESAERALAARLRELGVHSAEHRFEGRDARFVWLDAIGVPLVEARAQVLATWLAEPSSLLVMAWADPVHAPIGIDKLEAWGDTLEVDRATARELLLDVAEASGAEFVFPLTMPHGEHYLALRALRPAPSAKGMTPGSPVGLVLRGIADLRGSVSRRDEPTEVLRARFQAFGKAILGQSGGTYADTEWVGRMERLGRVLTHLGGRLSPPTFSAIAAGRPAEETLDQAAMIELIEALKLMEDEWTAFV